MKTQTFCVILCSALLLWGITPVTFGDWNEGEPYKWLQRPDLNPTGLDICVDDTGVDGQRTIGDDFECNSPDPITGVHLWGSWRGDVKGQINSIHLSFYTDIPDPDPQDPATYSQPGELLWERWYDDAQFTERLYFTMPEDLYEGWWDPRAGAAWIPNGDTQVWQYNIDLKDDPFIQEGTPDQPIIYWLVVEVKVDPSIDNASFGWKTRDREDGHFMDDAVWFTPTVIPWHELRYPAGDPTSIIPPHPYNPDSIDMAFVLTTDDTPPEPDKEYGDAPESDAINQAIAYPSTNQLGYFPTCLTIGAPGSYVEHTNFGAWFGAYVDFEYDGNGGQCPNGCFPPYDVDECFDNTNNGNNTDPGLIMPESFTISSANTVVACPPYTGTSLGQTCQTAVWGQDIDIWVHNMMPGHDPYLDAYVNVLVDWNQDGVWGGSSTCTGGVTVPEHILVDHRIPAKHVGTLSSTMTPGVNDFFTIGPNPGYVWVRFMISEAQVGKGWGGAGSFEDGESEDYLLRIDLYQPPDELDFGDAPDSPYPTLLATNGARHIISANGPYFDDGTGTDFPDAEPDGQQDPAALGDDNDYLSPPNDDEDGVIIPPLVQGQTVTITFNVGGPGGTVEAFIDWNADGDWADAGEALPPVMYAPGPAAMNVTVPSTATVGPTFARFRISSMAGAVMGYTGQAPDGEVEDHEVRILEGEEKLKFQQLPLDGVPIEDFRYWGHDELSTAWRDPEDTTFPPHFFQGCYMADDFADLEHSPVIKIKWWGSYLENFYDPPSIQVDRFLIAFEKDVPAVGIPGEAGYVPSHPGEVLLTQFVHRDFDGVLTPGEFSEVNISPGGPPCNEMLFEYESVLENPFPQDPNTVYWLKIVAMVEAQPGQLLMIKQCGIPLCELGRQPWSQIIMQCPELEQWPPLIRWGWHNRDYTKMDPYASVPPAVVPGEHIQGVLPDGTNIWHFQDDAVTGEVFIDEATPEMPIVEQPTWMEEYYKYFWPLCPDDQQGVDGPEDIERYSKDLAFELWTPTECVKPTAPFYSTWALFGKPDCWCYQRNCRGDADGLKTGLGPNTKWITSADLTVFAAAYNQNQAPLQALVVNGVPGICADNDRAKTGLGPNTKWVNSADLAIFATYYNVNVAGVPVCDMTNYYFWTN